MKYLKSRAPRERLLIYVMVVCIAVFIGGQFVIKPIFTAKARAQAELVSARHDLSLVQAGLPRLTSSGPILKDFNQSSVIDVARAINISISRVQPQSDKSFRVWFDNTPSLSIYAFLFEIKRDYAVDISRVNMNRQEDGLVSAQITLTPISG